MAVAYSWLIAGMVEKEIGIVKVRALAVEQEIQRFTEKVPRKYFSAPAL
jgi:hypothetical protein